jgi:hypothetical protein
MSKNSILRMTDLFLLSACGDSGTPVTIVPEVVSDTPNPVVDQPIVSAPTPSQSKNELQESATDVLTALRDGSFSGPALPNEEAPSGRAFYHGLMTIRRADG